MRLCVCPECGYSKHLTFVLDVPSCDNCGYPMDDVDLLEKEAEDGLNELLQELEDSNRHRE